jgi:hypothetical protein
VADQAIIIAVGRNFFISPRVDSPLDGRHLRPGQFELCDLLTLRLMNDLKDVNGHRLNKYVHSLPKKNPKVNEWP